MKSRITIEVNFEEGNLPIIQIVSQNSDDVRDKLIQSFLQSLQHTSRWCKILYKGNASTFAPPLDLDDPIHRWHIVPIRPKEIEEEIKLMETLVPRDASYPSGKEDFRESNRLDLMSAAEKSITDAMYEVEKAGASKELTDAVIKLGEARDLVYLHYKNLA